MKPNASENVSTEYEVSVRFIHTVSKQSVGSLSALDEQAKEQLQTGVEAVQQAAAAVQNQVSQNPDVTQLEVAKSQIEALLDRIHVSGVPAAIEVTMLVAEMRLMLPNNIVNLAQVVATVSGPSADGGYAS